MGEEYGGVFSNYSTAVHLPRLPIHPLLLGTGQFGGMER